jgi:hypothetical protein
MHTYQIIGPGGERIIQAADETEARHLAMLQRWGDCNDDVTPRPKDKFTGLRPRYKGLGLTVHQLT